MNSFFSFQVHGNAGHSGGLLEMLTGLLAFFENLTSGGGNCGFLHALLPGMANIANIHPMLVHFPIALLSCFFVLDVLGSVIKKPNWREAASYFLYLGAVTAIFTVLAGFQAAYSVIHSETVHHIMERHEHIGLTVLTLALVLAVWRFRSGIELQDGAKYTFFGLSTLMCILLMFGADLGGLMVYSYGTAIRTPMDCQQATPE
jgi:uncharacterized membrane protein